MFVEINNLVFMRAFSDFEKEIIKTLSKFKKEENSICDIKTFFDEKSVSRIYFRYADFIAIEWDADFSSFKIVVTDSGDPEKNKVQQIQVFSKLCEISFLLKYLEENNLIGIIGKSESKESKLYNHDLYKLDTELHTNETRYFKRSENVHLKIYFEQIPMTIPTSFGKLLERYAFSLIHVSDQLCYLADNEFITKEQQNHDESIKIAEVGVREAKRGSYIALGIGIVSFIFTLFNTCSSTKETVLQKNYFPTFIESNK